MGGHRVADEERSDLDEADADRHPGQLEADRAGGHAVSAWIFVACAIVAAGVGFVFGAAVMARPKVKSLEPVEPICGCEHHLCMHDPETGVCHDWEFRGAGNVGGCECVRYVGPVVVEAFYHPGLAFGRAEQIIPDRKDAP
jgi:hypothetical protein